MDHRFDRKDRIVLRVKHRRIRDARTNNWRPCVNQITIVADAVCGHRELDHRHSHVRWEREPFAASSYIAVINGLHVVRYFGFGTVASRVNVTFATQSRRAALHVLDEGWRHVQNVIRITWCGIYYVSFETMLW
jgi:hypothetical protein